MQKENKKDEQKDPSTQKIDYAIRTMNSDIKNQKTAVSSFSVSSPEENPKPEPEKKKEEKPEPKKPFNPFLRDLKSTKDDSFDKFPEKKESEKENSAREKKAPIEKREIEEETKKDIIEKKVEPLDNPGGTHPSFKINSDTNSKRIANLMETKPEIEETKKIGEVKEEDLKETNGDLVFPEKEGNKIGKNNPFQSPLLEKKSRPVTPFKPIKPIKNNNGLPSSLEKEPENKKTSNALLLAVLFVVSIITVGAGFYYFQITKTPPTEPLSPSQSLPSDQPSSKSQFPEKLENSSILSLEEGVTLPNKLKSLKSAIKLFENSYYQPAKKSTLLTPKEIFDSLEIQFPESIFSNFGSGWVSLNLEEDILKTSLVIEIKNSPEETTTFMKNNEYRLPEMLKPLFIDEAFVSQDSQIEFKNSKDLENVRYYNLTKGFDNRAIDWGIIDDKYLVITTSKSSMENILNDLSEIGIKKDSEVDEMNSEAINPLEMQ